MRKRAILTIISTLLLSYSYAAQAFFSDALSGQANNTIQIAANSATTTTNNAMSPEDFKNKVKGLAAQNQEATKKQVQQAMPALPPPPGDRNVDNSANTPGNLPKQNLPNIPGDTKSLPVPTQPPAQPIAAPNAPAVVNTPPPAPYTGFGTNNNTNNKNSSSGKDSSSGWSIKY